MCLILSNLIPADAVKRKFEELCHVGFLNVFMSLVTCSKPTHNSNAIFFLNVLFKVQIRLQFHAIVMVTLRLLPVNAPYNDSNMTAKETLILNPRSVTLCLYCALISTCSLVTPAVNGPRAPIIIKSVCHCNSIMLLYARECEVIVR
jgi:exosortase/archaeosortase